MFSKNDTLTVKVVGKRGKTGEFFKAEGFTKDSKHFSVFVHQPDDPPLEWWEQVCMNDSMKVVVTGRSTADGIANNCKSLGIHDQPFALQRAIRNRQRGLIGKVIRVEASLLEEELADLKFAHELEKERFGRSLLQSEVTRDLLIEGLRPYRITRLQSIQNRRLKARETL